MEPPNEAFDRCVDLFDSRGKKMEKASEIRFLLQSEHLTSFHSIGQKTIVSDFFIIIMQRMLPINNTHTLL